MKQSPVNIILNDVIVDRKLSNPPLKLSYKVNSNFTKILTLFIQLNIQNRFLYNVISSFGEIISQINQLHYFVSQNNHKLVEKINISLIIPGSYTTNDREWRTRLANQCNQ